MTAPRLLQPDPGGPGLPTPRRLLLLRLSAIGDVVMAMPLLTMLRNSWPQAHIAWLVQSECAPLLRGHPDLDQVIELPRARWRQLRRGGHWLRLARELGGFVRDLRRQQFDTAIDIQGLLKSALWARVSGANLRVGLDPREGSSALMTHIARSTPDDPRMASEYRHLADCLGLAGEFRPRLPLTAAAQQQARALVGDRRPYAVLCPFTTRPQKHWFPEHWIDLALRLEHAGLTPVMLGGPGDRSAADDIHHGAPAIVNLVGRTGLPEAAAVIADAAVLVGVDTGLTHMASGLGVPALALFGSTRPYLDTGVERVRVLYHALPCSPCRRHPTCNGRYDCMRAHTPADVFEALSDLGVLP
jgi:heptosyltransferase-1